MDLLKTIRESLAKDIRILLVDDEEKILASLKREMKDQSFTIETFSDVRKAVERLKTQEFAMVIADNVMPHMTGIELLNLMKVHYPATKRILLTGQTSTEDAIGAFNSGIIHRFINKPWDKIALMYEVQAAIESFVVNKVEAQLSILKNKIIEKRTAELHEIKSDLINTQTQLAIAKDLFANQHAIPPELLPLRYMIIEKKEEVALEYTHALNHAGINNTVHFINGFEALKYYEEKGADVILSEWEPEQLSGLEFLKVIRKKHDVLYQPIFIFTTILANIERIENAQSAHTDGFVIKPFTLNQLFEVLLPKVTADKRLTPQATNKNLKCFSVLVVDSSKSRETHIRQQLQWLKFVNVEMASDTEKALAAFERRHFDLVLFDIHTKGEEWNEVLKIIESSNHRKKTSLIVTAYEPGIGKKDEEGELKSPQFKLANPYSDEELQEIIIDALNSNFE